MKLLNESGYAPNVDEQKANIVKLNKVLANLKGKGEGDGDIEDEDDDEDEDEMEEGYDSSFNDAPEEAGHSGLDSEEEGRLFVEEISQDDADQRRRQNCDTGSNMVKRVLGKEVMGNIREQAESIKGGCSLGTYSSRMHRIFLESDEEIDTELGDEDKEGDERRR